jgi:hypothetical protein
MYNIKKAVILILTIYLLISTILPISIGTRYSNISSSEINDIVNIQSEIKTPHDSIFISRDSEFTYENGVIGGNGTKSNPYIIAGWIVENITIGGRFNERITKNFTIRDCEIHGKFEIIYINNVDAIIEKNTFFGNKNLLHLITLDTSHNIRIKNCKILRYENCSYGIIIINGANHIIKNCVFESVKKKISIVAWNSQRTVVENCYFNNSYVGIKSDDYSIIR